jgi:methyl-accepting chemotaxis protein
VQAIRFFPPLLILRALDDLHELAIASRNLSAIDRVLAVVEGDLARRADELEDRLGSVLSLAERIESGLPSIEALLKRLDELNSQLGNIATLARPVTEVLPAVERINESVSVLTETTSTLAAAVGPLQGASERLGRIADRLPGAGKSRNAAH